MAQAGTAEAKWNTGAQLHHESKKGAIWL